MVEKQDTLTLTVAGLSETIDAKAFAFLLSKTIEILEEVNKAISEYGASNIEWRISRTEMNSPLATILEGIDNGSKQNGVHSQEVFEAVVGGVNRLRADDSPPPFFSERGLKLVSDLLRAEARGITRIEYAARNQVAVADKTVSANAITAGRKLELIRAKKSGRYVEYTELEGHLKDLSELSGKDKVVIVDTLTGRQTPCYFRSQELDQKARTAWKCRVLITGDLTVDRLTGDPIEMQADSIRVLRTRDELPQMIDLFGIDITGGIESSDYVRGLRDGE